MSADSFEPFTLVERGLSSSHPVYDDYEKTHSAQIFDLDVELRKFLREQYPRHILTVVPEMNVSLVRYAAAGNASMKEDTKTDHSLSFRGYIRRAAPGTGDMADAIRFAKYNYKALDEEFIMYYVLNGRSMYQYILKEPTEGESLSSHSSITDALVATVGEWQRPEQTDDIVYVYDGYWQASKELYKQVQNANWADVILDPDMKIALKDITRKFFDSKDVYDDLGVPWRRGIMFHGPAGNGKTISIKALMKTLHDRHLPVPSLYVKAASNTFQIRQIFEYARMMSPCMLVLEDIDTIVNPATRSYFFNEVDGLENNNGILMVATTNHLEQLDPGLSKRPSRFDRKYLFPLPSEAERRQYCAYWRQKLMDKGSNIDFPTKLCSPMASITGNFSFAYMKEAFVASLLMIAGNQTEDFEEVDNYNLNVYEEGLDDFELWRVFKFQVKILRDDMGNTPIRMRRAGDSSPVLINVTPTVVHDGGCSSFSAAGRGGRGHALPGGAESEEAPMTPANVGPLLRTENLREQAFLASKNAAGQVLYDPQYHARFRPSNGGLDQQ